VRKTDATTSMVPSSLAPTHSAVRLKVRAEELESSALPSISEGAARSDSEAHELRMTERRRSIFFM
jgi:hypothetical protein